MPHFSLWTDMAVMFAVVIVVIVLAMFHFNNRRRPRPMRRKAPERIDIRLAEILEQGRESPAEMPVQDELRQEAEWEPPAEAQADVAGQPAESLPEVDHALEMEDAPREEAMVFPREVGAGSARLFRREEEEPVESEPDGESNELRQRLKDRYSIYLREKDAS